MSFVAVGRFVGVFGVSGELKCRPTPAGELTLVAKGCYALDGEGRGERVTFAGLRLVGGRLVARVEGVASIEAATPLVGRDLFVERDRVVLAHGEFLDDDLIGLRLIDLAGVELGRVAGVEHYPAQDCLVLADRKGLVPLIRAFVRHIDLVSGTIRVTLPEGLIEP